MRTQSILIFLAAAVMLPSARGEDFRFFETHIRPVLVDNCYKCHSVEAKKSKGDLLLDSRDGVRIGGESGPAVVPGDPDKSLLLTAIMHADPDLKMPPKKAQLPATTIAHFKQWITNGAPDPRESTGTVEQTPNTIAAGREFWSFKPPVTVPRPKVKDSDWPVSDLDYFVLESLEQNKLAPSADASPEVLVRRLHFDIVGLPPTPSETVSFIAATEKLGLSAAIERKVDQLLASPRYAERWARHWLDVARFAESSGKETNVTFPHAWRYRDYVIDCFAQDMPYDRFLLEQIAGDLLPADSDAERARLTIATGFLAVGPKSLAEANPAQMRADVADEQIDAVTRAVLGSSVACARCHDHKYDPFSMKDYYALAGVFTSSKTFYGTAVAAGNQLGGDYLVLPRLKEQLIPNPSIGEKGVERLHARKKALQKEKRDGMEAAMKARLKGEDPAKYFAMQDAIRIIWQTGTVDHSLKTVDDEGNALPLAMGVNDRPEIADSPIYNRGELKEPGTVTPRAFPEVIRMREKPVPPAGQSGRIELAQWLTHPDNPLTARVMANRIWHHLFGAGIVRTVDNFGFKGERPSHPELLDYLALRLVANKWSIESLIREIVLSRTYRQASTWRETAFNADPDNRLLWRANKRRLEAEAIRDSMLFTAGQLDFSRRNGSLVADFGPKSVSLMAFSKRIPADQDASLHRSIYLPIVRDRLPDVLDLFDFADPGAVNGARENTNVPLQSLYFMNSEYVLERARGLAEQMGPMDRERKVSQAYLHCFARGPTADEKRAALEYLAERDDADALTRFCQALMMTSEFRTLE